MIPPRIKSVEALDDFSLKLMYENNEKKIFSMKKRIEDDEYKNLRNIAYFKLVKSVGTTVEWINGEDMDPNDLYENGITVE